jgi:glycosyltransferase involved in cell wall biosynthesis
VWGRNLKPDGSHPLLADEAIFLAGSLCVDLIDSLGRFRRPEFGIWKLARLVKRAKSRSLSVQLASEILGVRVESLNDRFLARFDHKYKDTSVRFAVGKLITASPNPLSHLMRVVRFGSLQRRKRIRPESIARPPGPAGSIATLETWQDVDPALEVAVASPDDELDRTLHRPLTDKASGGMIVSGWSVLDAWHDSVPEVDWLDDLALEVGEVSFERADIQAGGARDQVQHAIGTPLRVPAANGAVVPKEGLRLSGQFEKTALRNWLLTLGHSQSGVRIETVADRLVDQLDAADARRVLRRANREGDLKALEMLVTSLEGAQIQPSARLLLKRLVSVYSCLKSGIPLPAIRMRPTYEADSANLLYLIHMRDPFEINGYVARSHLMLAAMRDSGAVPIAVTRLGFPRELSRHRNAIVAAEEVIDGVQTLSIADPENGLVGRSLHSYIESYADRVVDIALKYRPAAIHAASNYLNGLAAICAARRLGIPSVYEVRGLWEITRASASPQYSQSAHYTLQRRLENEVVTNADQVVVISEPLRKYVVQQGAKQECVTVVGNGVDTDRFRLANKDRGVLTKYDILDGDVVIGFVGSVVWYEGLDYVLRALKLLHDEGLRSFKFMLVGKGPELSALERLATELRISAYCVFVGAVGRSEVDAFYSAIDIVALPRRSVPVTELVPPLKQFEAMASGKAIIVSSVAALAESVVHGHTGLVVEHDNIEALASAIKQLAGNPSMRRDLGLNARAWVKEERSIGTLADRLRHIYRSLGVPLN